MLEHHIFKYDLSYHTFPKMEVASFDFDSIILIAEKKKMSLNLIKQFSESICTLFHNGLGLKSSRCESTRILALFSPLKQNFVSRATSYASLHSIAQ